MHIFRFRGGSASKERDSSPRTDQSSPNASSNLLFSPSSSSPSSLGRSLNGGSAALGRPLRLVYCDVRGKFHLDPEAVAALQLVKAPVGVVSVCGRARQGKSFILNQVSFSILHYYVFCSVLTKHTPLSLVLVNEIKIETAIF
jgi:Guanylate-binding protein, N-terminal domain